jgi:hypothetical protein
VESMTALDQSVLQTDTEEWNTLVKLIFCATTRYQLQKPFITRSSFKDTVSNSDDNQ